MVACEAELISVDTHLMQGPCWRQRVPSAAPVCLDDQRGRWGPGKTTEMPVSFNLRAPGVCTSLFKGLLVPAKCLCFLWAMRSISSFLRMSFWWLEFSKMMFISLEVWELYHSFNQKFGLISLLCRALVEVRQAPILCSLWKSHR